MRRLIDVDLNITNRCNFKCSFCSASVTSISCNEFELPLSELSSLFDEFILLGVEVVRIVGGEPFVREDISDILKLISRYDFSVRILTNGSAITRAHIDLIKELGIDYLFFSIDGHIAKLHDKSRGRNGAFKRALSMINYCNEIGVHHRMMTVVTSHNIAFLNELVLFAEQLKFEMINFIMLGFSGFAMKDIESFPSYGNWSKAFVDLSIFLENRPLNIQASVLVPHEDEVPFELYDPLNKAGLLPLLLKVWNINYLKYLKSSGNKQSYCAAGQQSITILANGDVYGCDLMRDSDEFKAGNILEEKVSSIFYNSSVLKN